MGRFKKWFDIQKQKSGHTKKTWNPLSVGSKLPCGKTLPPVQQEISNQSLKKFGAGPILNLNE
jgi:hypothetical protein